MRSLSFDIFCRVIDNFGDIGVCWRLARQLAGMPPGHKVRLWIDDLQSFARIQPGIDFSCGDQNVCGVDIVHWSAHPPSLPPHEVVIEAFACNLPADFLQRMVARNSLWINLEYLSAETWVESCHALPSPQANGLRKFFFFPGFTSKTAGLLREDGLLETRDAWRRKPHHRRALLSSLGVHDERMSDLGSEFLQVALFAYDTAPVQGLLQGLNTRVKPTLVLVPTGVCPGLRRQWHGKVLVRDIPFSDQDGFDRLLWTSDLNCVRGEDSVVRALWAGRPFVWHIYAQQDEAHLLKLKAFLDRTPPQNPVRELHMAWNQADNEGVAQTLARALADENWTTWNQSVDTWCGDLAAQPDLASSLLSFCQAAPRQAKDVRRLDGVAPHSARDGRNG